MWKSLSFPHLVSFHSINCFFKKARKSFFPHWIDLSPWFFKVINHVCKWPWYVDIKFVWKTLPSPTALTKMKSTVMFSFLKRTYDFLEFCSFSCTHRHFNQPFKNHGFKPLFCSLSCFFSLLGWELWSLRHFII